MRLAFMIPLLLALVVGVGPAGAGVAPSAHGGAAHGTDSASGAPCETGCPVAEAAAPCEASCPAAGCDPCREAAGAVPSGSGSAAWGAVVPPGLGRDEAPEPAPPKGRGRA